MRAARYQLRSHLSEEGSAAVWEGYDAALERRVLIKQLRPEFAADADAVERFRRDAREAAGAEHSSGWRVLDAGYDDRASVPFVVFEWPEDSLATDEAAQLDSQAPTRPLTVLATDDTPRPRPGRAPRLVQHFVLLLLLIPLIAGGMLVRSLLGGPASGSTDSPVSAATSVLPASRPTPVQAADVQRATPVAPTPRPAAVPTQQAEVRRRIVNTDGIGVALRGSPGGDRLPGKGYDEGVTVTVLEQSGSWAHIRGDDGREGWVLAVTLG